MPRLAVVGFGFGFGVLALSSCKDEEPSPIEIPADVHGLFGRTADDLYHGTRGLEIDASSLRFSEMTLVVTDGKMVGDTFQIGRAEVRWKKDDPEKLPKLCKGTLARQGDRLLLTLFKVDSDEPCESILKGEWSEWKETTTMPKALHGQFGGSDPYDGTLAFTIADAGVTDHAGGQDLKLGKAYAFVGRDGELFVTEASVGETKCHGTIAMRDDEMAVAMSTDDENAFCPLLGGVRWSVDATKIPKGTLSNGKVTAKFDGETVTLTNGDEPALTCTQKVVRTSSRSTTDKSMDDLPVLAGQVLTLQPAAPNSGAASCEKRLGNLMEQRCQEQLGTACPEGFDAGTDVQCPTHLIVGDPSSAGRKVALLPNEVETIACYDVTGAFKGS